MSRSLQKHERDTLKMCKKHGFSIASITTTKHTKVELEYRGKRRWLTVASSPSVLHMNQVARTLQAMKKEMSQ